ncbi:hypothetical protein OBBRIDRAFT_798798 [Obba rivulosa]|uniref:Uncharacterized protein n=1 Tax=Obba rivulosa TaxID=1052685 RepID=A0A8E2AHY2_9APHY|nr:hypothetical protein OBBRIDRAFT_798798 [Obba rivulosa]
MEPMDLSKFPDVCYCVQYEHARWEGFPSRTMGTSSRGASKVGPAGLGNGFGPYVVIVDNTSSPVFTPNSAGNISSTQLFY